jgi:adenylosuccinate synthase
MDKTGRIRVGDIELEDFKERYRALADKHEAMISYDVNIQYNLDELEKEFFESIELKLDFIDSEVSTPSSKAGKSILCEELKVLYWM